MSTRPHPVDIHVGTMLRRQRCYLGMSQSELADSAGITFQQLQKYESAANRVSASRLWELARALAVPVEAFFPAGAETTDKPAAWQDDPAFLRWVRLYHSIPAGDEERLIRIVGAVVRGRY